MADDKLKVLLDTDIGSDIDDAVALAYLLSQPRCDLVGVTTVSGQPIKRAQMVSAICRNVGRDDVPIHSGTQTGIIEPVAQTGAAQAKALEGLDYRKDFPQNTAIEFMRQTIRANPGQITLLAIGPMTNVGLLFCVDPEIPSLLKDLVLMCGRFFKPGGEWNAVNDIYATAVTYGQGPQAKPARHVSYGLDVTNQCKMSADACREAFTAKVLEPVRSFAEVWFNHAKQVTFHDPLAAACIFEPDLCQYVEGTVKVSLAQPTRGWTVFNPKSDEKPHQVAKEVDPERFFKHYFEFVK